MKFENSLDRELERPEFKKWWDKFGPGFEAGNLLIGIRAGLDLTQQALADRAGVKRSYIGRIESGDANPTVKSLARILASVGLRLVLRAEPQSEPLRGAKAKRTRRRGLRDQVPVTS